MSADFSQRQKDRCHRNTSVQIFTWTIVDGDLESLWYEGDVLPQQLADIVYDAVDSDNDNSDSDGDASFPPEGDCEVDCSDPANTRR